MRKALVFEAQRTGYGIDQIANNAITVGDLIEFLQEFEEDTLFVLSHGGGYTYGSIKMHEAIIYEETEDGEFAEAEY